MKRFIILPLLFIICISNAQEHINKIVFDENANENILIGHCTKEGFLLNGFSEWFVPEYDNYTVDQETLNKVNSDLLPEIEILSVVGTWCSDSKREVPRFFKITETLNFEPGQIETICVDKNKKAEKIPIVRMEIELVPTFIFYHDGKEIGRIIESPEESLEKDILKMLSKI